MIAREYPSFSQAQIFPSFSQTTNSFVTFEYGSGIPSYVSEVVPGRKITRPATPVRKGYTFNGWFSDKSFFSEWDFSNNTIGGGNLCLYAKWVPIVFSITYFLNGGINDPRNPSSYTVEDIGIRLEKAVRNEDKFIAWYDDAMFSRYPTEVIPAAEARDLIFYARFTEGRNFSSVINEPKINRFEGEPKLFLLADGAEILYEAGQPIMEQGLENQAYISLFTRQGWLGNVFLQNNYKIGSDFEETCEGAITRTKLVDIEDAAAKALLSKAFPHVNADARNPVSDKLLLEATVNGGAVISLSREGALWQNQQQKGLTIAKNKGRV